MIYIGDRALQYSLEIEECWRGSQDPKETQVLL